MLICGMLLTGLGGRSKATPVFRHDQTHAALLLQSKDGARARQPVGVCTFMDG